MAIFTEARARQLARRHVITLTTLKATEDDAVHHPDKSGMWEFVFKVEGGADNIQVWVYPDLTVLDSINSEAEERPEEDELASGEPRLSDPHPEIED